MEQTFATCCSKPLLAQYDLHTPLSKDILQNRSHTIWRYFELLPVQKKENIVSLNEGFTPIVSLKKLGDEIGFASLYLKDESQNPTGSFKARGLAVAISKAKEFGRTKIIIPTAGNAGGALAAYCAKANMQAVVVMPEHTPQVFKDECRLYGADVILVNGLINDCAKKAMAINADHSFFDVSTLKEPYRLEGKKTMGYEMAEQFNWQLPDTILYPAGGGTGLIGIWKAFHEMQQLGWITGPLPRMIAVQSANCAPIQSAIKNKAGWMNDFVPQKTIANGLAVPYPFGMDLMLKVIQESNGCTITVDEETIINTTKLFAKQEGLLISPEGASTYHALLELNKAGIIKNTETVLLLNTGSGYKYIENII